MILIKIIDELCRDCHRSVDGVTEIPRDSDASNPLCRANEVEPPMRRWNLFEASHAADSSAEKWNGVLQWIIRSVFQGVWNPTKVH